MTIKMMTVARAVTHHGVQLHCTSFERRCGAVHEARVDVVGVSEDAKSDVDVASAAAAAASSSGVAAAVAAAILAEALRSFSRSSYRRVKFASILTKGKLKFGY